MRVLPYRRKWHWLGIHVEKSSSCFAPPDNASTDRQKLTWWAIPQKAKDRLLLLASSQPVPKGPNGPFKKGRKRLETVAAAHNNGRGPGATLQFPPTRSAPRRFPV